MGEVGCREENRDGGGPELIGDVYPSSRLPGPVPGRKIDGNGAGPWDSGIGGTGLSFLDGEDP